MGRIVVLICALVVAPLPARAYVADSGQTACGSSPAGFNVPVGAAMASRGRNSPVVKLIDQLGEYYTHQMLSFGPSWQLVAHATSKNPRINVGIFGTDKFVTEDIRHAYPGPAAVNAGGLYKVLYGANGGAVDVTWTSGGSTGEALMSGLGSLPFCDDVWDGICWAPTASQQDGGETLYLLGRRVSGTTYRHSYGYYQYANDRSVPEGDDQSDPGWAMQCSTFVAWALAWTGLGHIDSAAYPRNSSVSINQLAYNLHGAVESDCRDQTGWFYGLFVNCDNLADQITNCFIKYDWCSSDNANNWKSFYGPVQSISPDRVLGVNGHGDAGGPWAGNPSYDVQWNSGGNVYGCWF